MKKFRIAVIPGDGIGKEVMPEGLRVMEAAGRKSASNGSWTNSTGAAITTTSTGA